ncbi:MAG: valine--tRNA ligase [Clostridiales bacterium]
MEKKYNFEKTEILMQNFWKDNKIYKFDQDNNKNIYSIDTPPPTVSGSLHIGHIFSYTQAEMIARFKRMQGFNVFYPFGFDDNGLPTERLVEKEEGINARNILRSAFNNKCINISKKYEENFKNLLQSMGFSVDWSLQYESISTFSKKISQKSFIKLFKEKKAYIKESPVLWCTKCQTSIAQAELDSIEKETHFNYLVFNVENTKLIIATTRPELLYGCVCLFVNPNDKRYTNYIGKNAKVPLYNFEIPIIADEKVETNKGTGIVMCATFGDNTDVYWYEEYKLDYRKVIMPNGKIEKTIPFIGDLKLKDGRNKIIEILNKNNLLVKSEKINHTLSIHERCGTEVEIILSKQFYIDILSNKEIFLKAANDINWYPNYMKKRYLVWVENLKWDWCISRQRYFGVPIPIWYCKDCKNIILPNENDLPIDPINSKPKTPCKCGCNDFLSESSVLDTWATSSLSPQINYKWEEENDISNKIFPMSMRTQSHDIIRTWTFYTIVKNLYHTGKIPWKDIMICGFVMAKKGEKISKSKNNSVNSPIKLIENHSADVIRYWSSSTKLGTDTSFSENELSSSKRFINKLYNASKFSIIHLKDYDSKSKPEFILPVDKWIIERCKETISSSTKHLNNYELNSARYEIDEFFWKDFCDYYLEIVKERLYQPNKHGFTERTSAQYTLYYILLNMLKLYAIYVPHMTEYIYQEYFREREKIISVHLLLWDKIDLADKKLILFGDKLKNIIFNTRKYKSEKSMSMKAEIECLIIETDKDYIDLFNKSLNDIKACCRAKEIVLKT